jgi:hypothetical protein
MKTRPRILLVDDHALMLDALEALLTDEWNVIGKIRDPDAVSWCSMSRCRVETDSSWRARSPSGFRRRSSSS